MSIDLKISQLDENFSPSLTDFVAVVVGGQTDKVQLGNLGLNTPLTPWTENIDADGFKLFDLGNVEINAGKTIFQGLLTALPAQTGLNSALTPIMMTGSGNNILFYLDDETIGGGQSYGGIQWGGDDTSGTPGSSDGERASIECIAREAAGGADIVFSVAQGNQPNTEALRIFMLRDVGIQPTKKIRFDGVVNGGTWISETSANTLLLTTQGVDKGIQIGENQVSILQAGLLFTTATVVPGDSDQAIWSDAGGFNQNVPTGDDYEWKKNGATVMSLLPNTDSPILDLSHGTQLNAMKIRFENGGGIQWVDGNRAIQNDTNGTKFKVDVGDQFEWNIEPSGKQEMRLNIDALDIDEKYFEMGAIAEPGTTANAATGRIYLDSGNSNHLSIKRDTVVVDLEANTQTPWLTNIDADDNNLDMGTGTINFRNSTQSINGVNNLDLDLRVPTSGQFNFKINNINQVAVHPTGLLLFDNPIVNASNITTGDTDTPLWSFERETIQANEYTIGEIRFRHDDAGAVLVNYGRITGVMGKDDGGNEEGSLNFYVTNNGQHDVLAMAINDTGTNNIVMNLPLDMNGNNITTVGDITLDDASNIIFNATTGTKIATATTQKIGFWNTTPVIQPTHIADPTGGATIDSEARTAINSILAQLATIGLQAAS